MASRFTTVALGFLLTLTSCVTDPPKHPGYDEAVREARENTRSREGRHYVRIVQRHMDKDLEQVLKGCTVRFPDKRGTRLLFRLDPSGHVTETIAYPEGGLSTCILERLNVFPLPPPPVADYWMDVHVTKWTTAGSFESSR